MRPPISGQRPPDPNAGDHPVRSGSAALRLGIHPSRRRDRHHLGGARRARRCGAGAQAVRAGRLQSTAIHTAAGTGAYPCRAAPPRPDAGAAVGGIRRSSSRRLRLQPVLRPLLAPGITGDHATEPCRGREAVRGLRRRYRAGVRRAHRGGARRQDLRGGARGLELHRHSRTGSAPMSMRSPSWAGSRRRSSATISRHLDLAAHYGTTIMPARPRGPRDKATVETAVLIVQRWILARLRNRRFFSLAELNVAARWWRDTTPA
jgi:hypothetical protein